MCNNTNTNSVNEEELWDQTAADLLRVGVATVNLSKANATNHGRYFSVIRHALHVLSSSDNDNDNIIHDNSLYIPLDADATHATGYHRVGGLSARYNAHREGFVVSNNQYEVFGQYHHDDDLSLALKDLSESMHRMAHLTMCAMERQLELPEGYLEEALGPFPTSSQFHVKRYVLDAVVANTSTDDTMAGPSISSEHPPQILLPMHTDPSVISVVLHDVPGRNPGCMGLQYYCHDHDHHHLRPPFASVEDERTTSTPRAVGEWREVPSHGHVVAVLFVGSVLSHMTGGTIVAAKHRVISSSTPPSSSRIAATLFVRPQLDARLSILPSPQLPYVRCRPLTATGTPPTFQEWISRVSKNYSKRRRGRHTVGKTIKLEEGQEKPS